MSWDERRILCDVLDQWEMRWCWTGDAVDQWDAGMRSRDRAQPMRSGGCCEGCLGGPGSVMPANQRGAAHIRCLALTLTHVRLGANIRGPMKHEMVLWHALSYLKFLISTKSTWNIILRRHVLWQGFWHPPMRCYNILTQLEQGDYDHMWRADIIQWWPEMWKYLVCRKIAKDEGRGNMYLALTFLLWPISSHVRGCVILGKTIRNEIRVLRTSGAHAKILTEKSRSWGNLRSVNKPPWW